MNSGKLLILWSALIAASLLLFHDRGYGDTLILKSGTLLVGKVKSSNDKSLVFKNYYGAFNVNRSDIDKLYITKTYREDIALRKRMGMDFSEEDIKRNYEAGEKKLTVQEEAKLKVADSDRKDKDESRGGGRILLEGAWLSTQGDVSDILPQGYGSFLAYEHGFDFRSHLVPGLRVEGGYLSYSEGEASLKGFSGSFGPVWLFPVPGGNLRFAMQPGASSLDVENGDLTASTFTFTFHSLFGYEYTFSNASLFINAHYLYLYDKDVFFSSAGISAGVSFQIW